MNFEDYLFMILESNGISNKRNDDNTYDFSEELFDDIDNPLLMVEIAD